jgi:hypothetical protein
VEARGASNSAAGRAVLDAFAVLQAIKPAIGSIRNKTASKDSGMDIDDSHCGNQEFRCYFGVKNQKKVAILMRQLEE